MNPGGNTDPAFGVPEKEPSPPILEGWFEWAARQGIPGQGAAGTVAWEGSRENPMLFALRELQLAPTELLGALRPQLIPLHSYVSYPSAVLVHHVPPTPKRHSLSPARVHGHLFHPITLRVETLSLPSPWGQPSLKKSSPLLEATVIKAVSISLYSSRVVALECGICCLWYDVHVTLSRGKHRKDG